MSMALTLQAGLDEARVYVWQAGFLTKSVLLCKDLIFLGKALLCDVAR